MKQTPYPSLIDGIEVTITGKKAICNRCGKTIPHYTKKLKGYTERYNHIATYSVCLKCGRQFIKDKLKRIDKLRKEHTNLLKTIKATDTRKSNKEMKEYEILMRI